MKYCFGICLAVVGVHGVWTNGVASGVVVRVQGKADTVEVKGKTLDENGNLVKIDQLTIYGCDDKTASVIPESNSPDGKGGYTLKLKNPPGPFTIYGSAKIGIVYKFARSGLLSPDSAAKNPVDLTFLPREFYTKKHGKDDFEKHMENTFKTLPADNPGRKGLRDFLGRNLDGANPGGRPRP